MYDKIDIEIPFSVDVVRHLNTKDSDSPSAFVDASQYEFKGTAVVDWEEGKPVFRDIRHQRFDTLSSSISGIAVGFFPEGNGFNYWPHIRLKASPSKILQGHNVFGTENIREGVHQILATFSMAFPKAWSDLSIDSAEVRFLDCTYSANIESRFFMDRIFKLFRFMASSRTKINNNFNDYLQIGNKDYNSQKIYLKYQEVLADLKRVQRRRQHDKVKILSDDRLHAFAKNLMRFEATIGHRRLDNLGIPRRLSDFLKWHDWYERAYNEPACRYLWRQNFTPFMKQLEGQTMMKVDDDSVREKIHLTHDRVKDDGRICKRRSNAVFKTFRQLKTEGYSQLAKENSKTFFRNIKFLEECGFSRAFLKTIEPDNRYDNVVPIVQLINIDLSNQRPDWYVEPKAGFEDRARLIRLAS